LDIDSSIPPVLVGDSHRLQQIMVNLISNAVKYNPQDTHIDVSVVRKGDAVMISVRNRGKPIPKEKQEQLFQKFARAETKGTEKTKGTGLGLFITKQVVELHGGEITFTSTEESGTTFYIKLPLS